MAKYSYEFKLKVVQAYLNGEDSYRGLSRKYGIPSNSKISKLAAASLPQDEKYQRQLKKEHVSDISNFLDNCKDRFDLFFD